MNTFLDVKLPYRKLAESLSETLARLVAEEALEVYFREEPTEARNTFIAAIRRHIVIPGFRPGYAHRASPSHLRQAVIEGWRFHEGTIRAVFLLWLEAKKELAQQVGAFLREAGIPIDDGMTRETLAGCWKQEEFQRWVSRIQEALTETASEEEIWLMLVLLTGRMPVPDDVYTEIAKKVFGEEEMPENLWGRILKEMHDLPFEAPEWDTLEDFLQAAKEIGEEKQQQRVLYLRRLELEQAIKAFRTVQSEWVGFFQMDRCINWDAAVCLPAQVEDALLTLQKLGELINRYKELYKRHPSTVAERREWQKQLDDLEEQILLLYNNLSRHLVGQVGGELPVPAPFPPVEEVESVDGLGKIFIEEETFRGQEAKEEKPIFEQALELPPTLEVELESLTPMVEEAPEELLLLEAAGESAPTTAEAPVTIETQELEEATSPSLEKRAVAEDEANRLLISLLCEDDVLTGYWLAWAMEHEGMKPVIRSPLIQAVQGSLWAMRLWPEQPSRIIKELRELPRIPIGQDKIEQWMGTAAALYLALIAPMDGWGDWLTIRCEIRALEELAATVRDFASLGLPLQPGEMQNVWSKEARENTLRSLSEEGQRWLANASSRRTPYQRASAVWRWMTSPDGDLYKWFYLVAENQRNRAEQVSKALENWQRESWVDRRIQEIDLELVGRRLSPIEGSARRQILRWAGEACDLAARWVQAVSHEHRFPQKEEWLQGQLRDLMRSFNERLPLIDEQIQTIYLRLANGVVEKAALHLLKRAISSLKRVFAISGDEIPGDRFDLPLTVLRERPFQQNLMYRLLWFPEASAVDMDISGEMIVREGSASKLLQTLTNPALRARSLEETVQQWLFLRDYRFLDDLLLLTPALGETGREAIETQRREALHSDLALLNNTVGQTIVAVEQALIDGLISDAERSRHLGAIEGVKKDIAEIEQKSGASYSLLNIRGLQERLREVQNGLDSRRQGRLRDQQERWLRLQAGLSGFLSQSQYQQIQRAVESALARGELRVVDEYLATLEGVLSGKKPSLESMFAVTREDRLREFSDAIQPLAEILEEKRGLTQRDILQGTSPPELGLPNLPMPRRQQIVRVLEAWNQLKKGKGIESSETEFQFVVELMSYLGFKPKGHSPVSLVHREPGLRHWRVGAVPERTNLVPVPQFGSERNEQYDVIGIWDRPGFNLMSALVERTVDRPAIVFYFGRLLKRQRLDLLRFRSESTPEVPILILDEVLLLFLAREYDVRLGTFFSCALPFTRLNPYVPFAAGVVPPEMFVGRRDEIQQLLDPRGPAIVYGGRQLGKSALLRQAWREFHNPQKKKFAVVEDIKSLGDPRAGLDYDRAFWDRIASDLNMVGFLDVSPISPAKLQERIRQQIKDQDCWLILLLDEADNLLEADAKQGFPLISALKNLMDSTERRFKVVFAGLHNVQRFQRIPNQPLAHLGEPIEVGPLEGTAARELLERPLRALGYRFGEDPSNEDLSILLHILSYTNYHPGLIQLFGKELVEHLRNRPRTGLPPFAITRADVETVYRQPNVRQAIRERFTWTLALDERYEAIALTMVVDQEQARDGFDRLYSPRQLKEIVSSMWAAGFEEMDQDRFRGYLEEMCGLGVLTYVQIGDEGRYRLRSPNVVHLMGTFEEIWERLIEISEKTPPPPLSLESHHALLDNAYSPLSYAQEGALKTSRSRVGMVFGSEALQIRYLKDATQRFVELPQDWEEVRFPAKGGKALTDWLSGQMKRSRPQGLKVFFRDLETALWTPEELEEQIRAAVKFASDYPRVRLIFALGPSTSWQWFQLPNELREELEEIVRTVIAIRPWDLLGIRQRLEQHKPELMAHDRQCRRVHEVTGGWPFLVERFLQKCRTDSNPIPPLERFNEELIAPNSQIREKFLKSLQIPAGTPSRLIGALRLEQEKYGGEDYWVPREIIHLLLEEEQPERVESTVDYLVRMSVLRKREAGNTRTTRDVEHEVSLDPVVYRLWDR